MAHTLGGKVASATTREYGETNVNIVIPLLYFKDLKIPNVFLKESYRLCRRSTTRIQKNRLYASLSKCSNGKSRKKFIWNSIPSRSNNSIYGTQVIKNFLYNVCHCSGDWVISSFVEDSIKSLKEKLEIKSFMCFIRWCWIRLLQLYF